MSLFHSLLAQGGRNYFVAVAGTGTGASSADPMSPADFLLVTLGAEDRVFFLGDDTF